MIKQYVNKLHLTLHLDTSAWTAAQNDLSQYLEVDLGRQYNISAIGTQGRQNTIDYVAEFRLESGIDGHDYNLYRDRNGNIKVQTKFITRLKDDTFSTNNFSTILI